MFVMSFAFRGANHFPEAALLLFLSGIHVERFGTSGSERAWNCDSGIPPPAYANHNFFERFCEG
jgi:hypothetical protein